MELQYEFTYHAMLNAPVDVGAGPFGVRQVFDVTGGQVEGERIKGRVLGGGGDWMLLGPDGFGRLDVRGQFETADGAHIYAQYFGVLELNAAVQEATSQGGETDFGEQYFRIAPRLETGDPRYTWVNQTLFVAEGRVYPGPGVEYRVYRVT
ncbi:MAG: DUF3237 domain-containing protein [Solirubrobacteraceae bacterium]